MGCPKCQCDEISPSGICLSCGYQVTAPVSKPEPASVTSSREAAREELPQWRQELAQRLQSIKKKRDALQEVQLQQAPEAFLDEVPAPAAAPETEGQAERTGPALRPRAAARTSRRRTSPVRERQTEAAPPPEQIGLPVPEQPESPPDIRPVQLEESRAIPDSVPPQQSPPEEPSGGNVVPFPAAAMPVSIPDKGQKLLLRRFLSGLLDLMIIVAGTAALILAADICAGIRMLGWMSFVNFLFLFLLVYLVYSLLFLGFSNQTVGMKMMCLRGRAWLKTQRPDSKRRFMP